MKKTLKILLFSVLVFILVGCSGGNGTKSGEEVVKMQANMLGIEMNTYLYHKEGQLTRQVTETIVNIEDLGGEDQYKEKLKESTEKLKDINGVKYESDLKDGIVKSTLEMDFDKVDKNELLEAGLLLDESSFTRDLQKAKEVLERTGYTEVK